MSVDSWHRCLSRVRATTCADGQNLHQCLLIEQSVWGRTTTIIPCKTTMIRGRTSDRTPRSITKGHKGCGCGGCENAKRRMMRTLRLPVFGVEWSPRRKRSVWFEGPTEVAESSMINDTREKMPASPRRQCFEALNRVAVVVVKITFLSWLLLKDGGPTHFTMRFELNQESQAVSSLF